MSALYPKLSTISEVLQPLSCIGCQIYSLHCSFRFIGSSTTVDSGKSAARSPARGTVCHSPFRGGEIGAHRIWGQVEKKGLFLRLLIFEPVQGIVGEFIGNIPFLPNPKALHVQGVVWPTRQIVSLPAKTDLGCVCSGKPRRGPRTLASVAFMYR